MTSHYKTHAEYLAEMETFGAPNYHPLPVVIKEGRGIWVWDTDGKKYMDCISAYSAVNQGHCHPHIYDALVKQAQTLCLTSRAVHNNRLGPLLKKICALTKMEMALPMNSGAEAVETTIKAMRKWGYEKKKIPEGKAEIIVASHNFHGRTTGIISFSTDETSRKGFGPYLPGFVIVPYGDVGAVEKAIHSHTVGIFIEPIQGEAGIILPPVGYLHKLKTLATKQNIIFALDEIQTGLGRTGKLFAFEHEEATPDLLTLGKALSGGYYPVSMVVGKRNILECLGPGTHGSTFGGNPLAMAIASAALDVILDENLSDAAAKRGEQILGALKRINSPMLTDVRGKGLMIAVDIAPSYGSARLVCEKLMAEGILAKDTHQKTIRLMPPLIITEEEATWLIKKLQTVFKGDQ